MNSQDIQSEIYRWATSGNFTAPYGVLTGRHLSSAGRDYLSVSFGRSRSLDCEVQIYNRNFIVVRTNLHGSQVFRDHASAQQFLDTL